jgi:hypothetical protein
MSRLTRSLSCVFRSVALTQFQRAVFFLLLLLRLFSCPISIDVSQWHDKSFLPSFLSSFLPVSSSLSLVFFPFRFLHTNQEQLHGTKQSTHCHLFPSSSSSSSSPSSSPSTSSSLSPPPLPHLQSSSLFTAPSLSSPRPSPSLPHSLLPLLLLLLPPPRPPPS